LDSWQYIRGNYAATETASALRAANQLALCLDYNTAENLPLAHQNTGGVS